MLTLEQIEEGRRLCAPGATDEATMWVWEHIDELLDAAERDAQQAEYERDLGSFAQYAEDDEPIEAGRWATREEAMESIFALAGGWGSEDDAKIVSYITSLETQLAQKEKSPPPREGRRAI